MTPDDEIFYLMLAISVILTFLVSLYLSMKVG